MKTLRKSTSGLALLLALGPGVAVSFAHSGSAGGSTHLSNAATLSGRASVQAVGASAELATASVKAVSGAAAVAFWTGGSAVAAGGSVVAAAGLSTLHAGASSMQAADRMWDFASSDPARRPALNRERSVPPLQPAAVVRKDPSPAEAMRGKL